MLDKLLTEFHSDIELAIAHVLDHTQG